jgi:hypothetical protein
MGIFDWSDVLFFLATIIVAIFVGCVFAESLAGLTDVLAAHI